MTYTYIPSASLWLQCSRRALHQDKTEERRLHSDIDMVTGRARNKRCNKWSDKCLSTFNFGRTFLNFRRTFLSATRRHTINYIYYTRQKLNVHVGVEPEVERCVAYDGSDYVGPIAIDNAMSITTVLHK